MNQSVGPLIGCFVVSMATIRKNKFCPTQSSITPRLESFVNKLWCHDVATCLSSKSYRTLGVSRHSVYPDSSSIQTLTLSGY